MTPADIVVTEPVPHETYMRLLGEGQIPFQRCETCQKAFFFPRVLCPECGSVELRWEAASGTGVIYSTTSVPQRDGPNYALCLVDLEEGFRMMSNVLGISADEVQIGDRVVGRVEAAADESPARVVFDKASE